MDFSGIKRGVGIAKENIMETSKAFLPFEQLTPYSGEEPEQWPLLEGTERTFMLEGNPIHVSVELDACMQYRPLFKEAANYYTNQFRFRKRQAVNDYDSFVNYFIDMYMEGLNAMLERAYSLLLPFGVFALDMTGFGQKHLTNYSRALELFIEIAKIEEERNTNAEQTGDAVGHSVRFGRFFFYSGIGDAVNKVAESAVLNAGMSMLGHLVTKATRLSQREKQEIYDAIDWKILIDLVNEDFYSTFYTLVDALIEEEIINGISTNIDEKTATIAKNLANPMFPKKRLASSICGVINSYPFCAPLFDVIEAKYPDSEEAKDIAAYFRFSYADNSQEEMVTVQELPTAAETVQPNTEPPVDTKTEPEVDLPYIMPAAEIPTIEALETITIEPEIERFDPVQGTLEEKLHTGADAFFAVQQKAAYRSAMQKIRANAVEADTLLTAAEELGDEELLAMIRDYADALKPFLNLNPDAIE